MGLHIDLVDTFSVHLFWVRSSEWAEPFFPCREVSELTLVLWLWEFWTPNVFYWKQKISPPAWIRLLSLLEWMQEINCKVTKWCHCEPSWLRCAGEHKGNNKQLNRIKMLKQNVLNISSLKVMTLDRAVAGMLIGIDFKRSSPLLVSWNRNE